VIEMIGRGLISDQGKPTIIFNHEDLKHEMDFDTKSEDVVSDHDERYCKSQKALHNYR